MVVLWLELKGFHVAKDPAFLFYPGDWLGGTMHLSWECKGAYMDLLMLQFQRGHMTSHMVGHLLGQRQDEIWPQIRDKFIIEDGRIWNERLRIEIEKRKKFTATRKNNLSGKNQYTKKETSLVGHMTSHMENRNENSINNKGEEFFKTNAEAHQWFVGNYQDIEKAKNILSNLGWASVGDEDVAAVLFHFLESQVDIEKQPKSDIRSHFKRWLNRQKSEDMVKLTLTIKNRHARLQTKVS